MKIAIPTMSGKLCAHFGHCEEFAIVEADKESKEIINTTATPPPPHEPGILPKWLHEQGADVIIAGGMGSRAQDLFAEFGIEVVVGATTGTPEEIVTAYLAGTLVDGGYTCDH